MWGWLVRGGVDLFLHRKSISGLDWVLKRDPVEPSVEPSGYLLHVPKVRDEKSQYSI